MRTNIPIEDQVVQSGHACLEAGFSFERPAQTCHMVTLSVKNQKELLNKAVQLKNADVKYELFYEPDDDMQWTALATEPIYGENRKLFSKMKLWRPK